MLALNRHTLKESISSQSNTTSTSTTSSSGAGPAGSPQNSYFLSDSDISEYENIIKDIQSYEKEAQQQFKDTD